MSVDVCNQVGDETFFSNAGWAFILNFAIEYGWRPAGTMPPVGQQDWNGNYDAPQGQTISATDAVGLAQAIRRGLIADDRSSKSREIATRLSHLVGAWVEPFDFSPQSVQDWQTFVRIAEKGPFAAL